MARGTIGRAPFRQGIAEIPFPELWGSMVFGKETFGFARTASNRTPAKPGINWSATLNAREVGGNAWLNGPNSGHPMPRCAGNRIHPDFVTIQIGRVEKFLNANPSSQFRA